jgi:hypothetical protein
MRVQKSVRKTFNGARTAARKAVAKLPQSTVRGFHDGRRTGRNFVENSPYVGGAVAGFAYGAVEAVVDWAASAIGWAWGDEDEDATEEA